MFQKSIRFRAAPSRYTDTNRAQRIYRLSQLIHFVFSLYAHNKPIYWQGIYNVSFPSCCTTNEEKAKEVMGRNCWFDHCIVYLEYIKLHYTNTKGKRQHKIMPIFTTCTIIGMYLDKCLSLSSLHHSNSPSFQGTSC